MATKIKITGLEALEIRSKLGMNQTDFWSPFGVTQSCGSRYESGRNIPRPVQILLAAKHGKAAAKREALAVVGVEAWLSGLKPLTNAADSVLAERRRQIEAEGYSPDHDDDHTAGELAQAAADLCVDGTDFRVVDPDGDEMLGWGLTEAHRSDRRRQLVIAGALVLAEIERIDRAHIASKEKK